MTVSIVTEFPFVPANKAGLARRKPIFCVGVNDANYMTFVKVNGKFIRCPFYTAWQNMLMRCYCSKYQAKNPTYNDCYVADDWLSFSNFREWMVNQEWGNMQLDKDIKIKGNKIYSQDTCLFIPKSLNCLLSSHTAKTNDLPAGVYFCKDNPKKPYVAQISIKGKVTYLGYYASHDLAHQAYIKEKNVEIERQADIYPQWSEYILQHKT